MEIKIERREVYGTERFYPSDDRSRVLARLVRKKTFDRRDLFLIKDLGFTVMLEHKEDI